MGHSTESTVYIKGARERSETAAMGMGPGLVTLTQCDQKRIVTINPQANTCMVMPLGGEWRRGGAAAPAAADPAARAALITFTVNTVDTGERQKMLGLDGAPHQEHDERRIQSRRLFQDQHAQRERRLVRRHRSGIVLLDGHDAAASALRRPRRLPGHGALQAHRRQLSGLSDRK